jgi:hypothetical protein
MTEPSSLDDKDRLALYERGWVEAGDLLSLISAVVFCKSKALPLPDWASDIVKNVLCKLWIGPENGKWGGKDLWQRNYKHIHRWTEVKLVRALSPATFKAKLGMKKTWINTWDAVAQIDAQSENALGEAVTGETIKSSYRLVERDLKTGLGRFAAHSFVLTKLG